MKDYKGKVCGITGAASGIGKAFALYAAEQGMRIALIDIEGDRLEDVKRALEIAAAGGHNIRRHPHRRLRV